LPELLVWLFEDSFVFKNICPKEENGMELVVNNFSMNFSELGKGLPVLLIHGYPLSQQIWEPQLEGLSDRFKIITPDLRGHGKSQAVPGPYSMEMLADDLAALLDALEIHQKVVVCGLSMGGYVAMAFYRKHAARMKALILTATRAADDTPQARLGRDATAETARIQGIAPIVETMLPKMFAPGTLLANENLVSQVRSIMMSISLEGLLGDLAGMRDRLDSRPMLNGIGIPTLVVHGREDQIIPTQEAVDMQKSIPGAQLELIPDSGHLVNMEQPNEFNDVVRKFLSNND
jgi:3-oxoadipate enol-lactonase